MHNDVFRPFRRLVYGFGHPNPGTQNALFKLFFFLLYSNKKYVEVAINDITKHLIILKWLIIQKY